MKVKTKCGVFRSALHRVKVAARGNREGTATVTIRDGNGEVQMSGGGTLAKASFTVEAAGNASIVLNGAKAAAVLGTAGADNLLTLTITEQEMRMKFESANIRIPALDTASELLTDDVWQTSSVVVESIKGKALKSLLSKVAYAAAKNDVRFYLNGINLCGVDGKIAMVATNGHILSLSRGEALVPAHTSMLIPIEVAEAIPSLIDDDDDVKIFKIGNASSETGFGLRTSTFDLKSPLLCGRFPDWKKIMPKKAERIAVGINAKALSLAIERVNIANMESANSFVRLKFKPDGLCILDTTEESADLVAADTGLLGTASWEAGYNPAYLLSSLKHVDGTVNLIVDEKGGTAPLMIEQGDNEMWSGLVMPKII